MLRHDSRTPRCWRLALRRIFNAQDFYDSIRPMIGLGLVLGITPYFVCRGGCHGERVVRETWYGFANAISRWLLIAFCYTYTLMHKESLIGYFMRNHISQMSARIHDIIGIGVGIVIFIMPIFLRRHLRHAMEKLVRIDRRLDRLHFPVSYRQILYQVLLELLLISALDATIIIICLVCLDNMEVRPSYQLTFIMMYELITISITICMFCLFAGSIHRRFKRLQKKPRRELSYANN
ncbi:uncharacterized protein LOC111602125 [Drosophila hydei]|uniref:Uncharacterized protein LOC111602125 n=1 Tax=Drosophila hydei TaxID=7224 RepID=A0A6J1M4G3_DROHY|nr:uncharacterized protein LOC111602125 [Drosophila hydei]